MPHPHPQFPNIFVYDDFPRAGAFYQVSSKDGSLSRLAKQAYGSGTMKWWQLINKSQYNSTFTRRVDSGGCRSAKVAYPKGYLAMCKPYPLLWIPGQDGGEPIQMESFSLPPMESEIQNLGEPNATYRGIRVPKNVLSAFDPKFSASVVQSAMQLQTDEGMMQGYEYPQVPEDLKKTGAPAWLGTFLMVAGISIAGIVFINKVGDA